jgi:hypothetical protein
MKRITGRFVLLIATAAVLPLVLYGYVSVKNLTVGTEQSVTHGNQAVAQQIAARIKLYFDDSHRVLASIGTQIRNTQLEQWQKEQILRNHVLDFPEFREISVFDGGGRLRVSSRVGSSTLPIPSAVQTDSPTAKAFYVSPPYIDADLLPTTTMAVPLLGGSEEPEWMIAEISLEELWRTVDRIKVGTQGYALLLDEQFAFIAHGNPNDKTLIAQRALAADEEQKLARAALEAAASKTPVPPDPVTFKGAHEDLLAVGAAIDNPKWTVIVERCRGRCKTSCLLLSAWRSSAQ